MGSEPLWRCIAEETARRAIHQVVVPGLGATLEESLNACACGSPKPGAGQSASVVDCGGTVASKAP